MRILHVVATAQRRGAEIFASDLVRALNATGVEQRVVVLRCKTIAATPTITFIVAVTLIVVRTPSTGSKTNPAATVPIIAPARLNA